MTTMAPQKLEMRPIDWPKPYAKNAKLHPEDQVKRLAATIKEHGWDQPIVTEPDGTIIKGHGRHLAAKFLGLTEVPVIIRHDLTKHQADAARIADNASSSLAYDTGMMQEELKRLMLEVADFDLDALALTPKDKMLLTQALDEAATDAIMRDTAREIEEHKSEDEKRVEKADAELIPLAKAFGFSRMMASDQRLLTSFMAEAEALSGKTGYEAFVEGLRAAVSRGLS